MHHAYLPKTYYLSMQFNHRTVNVTANSKQLSEMMCDEVVICRYISCCNTHSAWRIGGFYLSISQKFTHLIHWNKVKWTALFMTTATISFHNKGTLVQGLFRLYALC